MAVDRMLKVDSVLKNEISSIMQKNLNDPRLNGVVITAVRTSRDLSLSKVYFIIYSNKSPQLVKGALEMSTGHIRSILNATMKIKRIPKLEFYHDDTIEHGNRVEELLREINHDRSRYEDADADADRDADDAADRDADADR